MFMLSTMLLSVFADMYLEDILDGIIISIRGRNCASIAKSIIACLSNNHINVYVSPGKNSVIANHKWTNIPFMMDIRNKKEAVKRRENFAKVCIIFTV